MSDFYQPQDFGATAEHSFETTFNVIKAMADEKRRMTLQQIMLPLTIAKTQAETAGITAMASVRAAEYKMYTERANAAARKAATGNSWNFDDPAAADETTSSYDPATEDDLADPDPSGVLPVSDPQANADSPLDGGSLSLNQPPTTPDDSNPLVAGFGDSGSSPFDGMQNVVNQPGGETASVGSGDAPVTLPDMASASPRASQAFSTPTKLMVSPPAASDIFGGLPDAPKAVSSTAVATVAAPPKGDTLESLNSRQDILDRTLASRLQLINRDTNHTDAEKSAEEKNQMVRHKIESDIIARKAQRLQATLNAEANRQIKTDDPKRDALNGKIEKTQKSLAEMVKVDQFSPAVKELQDKLLGYHKELDERTDAGPRGFVEQTWDTSGFKPDEYSKAQQEARQLEGMLTSRPDAKQYFFGGAALTKDQATAKLAEANSKVDAIEGTAPRLSGTFVPNGKSTGEFGKFISDPSTKGFPVRIVLSDGSTRLSYSGGDGQSYLDPRKIAERSPESATVTSAATPDTLAADASKIDVKNPDKLAVLAYQQNAKALVDKKTQEAADIQKQIDAEQKVIDRMNDPRSRIPDRMVAVRGGYGPGDLSPSADLKTRNEAMARQAVLKAKLPKAHQDLTDAQIAKARFSVQP